MQGERERLQKETRAVQGDLDNANDMVVRLEGKLEDA